MQDVELLAPAGGAAAFHAAICGGADAVYLGLQSFNARRGADNFTLGSFSEACDFAHLRGAKVYVTLNTAILPSEIDEALECARQAYRAGADAFIVQDIGLASELSRTLPQARLHISTQMNTHNAAGMMAAAKLGAKRVTLARELSLGEIDALARVGREHGLEIETFAHGALCVCYSGQCFMSSLIGGRSANRGLCAQACRLPYELRNAAQRKPLDSPGDHLLSPKDLCTIDLLPNLVAAGVSSLKIEGRMKSPEYVYAVTRTYRAALDRVLEARAEAAERVSASVDADGESALSDQASAVADVAGDCGAWDVPPVSEAERQVLAEAFSRGFTTAYLEGARGNDIMSYQRPNNRGISVGRIQRIDGDSITMRCSQIVEAGDVLEVWMKRGHAAASVLEVASAGKGASRIRFDKFPRGAHEGDRVFRVRSAAAAFSAEENEPRIKVDGTVTLQLGKPLAASFRVAKTPENARMLRAARDADQPSGYAEGPLVEPARTKAVSEQDVRAHVDRLGQTPFSLANLSVEMDEGVGIGFSQLHHVRAAALEELENALLATCADRDLPRIDARHQHRRADARGAHIAALVTNPACARAAKRNGAEVIYVPAVNLVHGQATVAGQVSETVEQSAYPKGCTVVLPVADHDALPGTRERACGFDAWKSVHEGNPVVAESLGALARAEEARAVVEVGPHLPITNKLALQTAVDLGASRIWLSPELTLGQIAELADDSPAELGITVIGSQELMVSEHCMLMSQGPCAQNCATCSRRKSPHFLKDRKGYEFPVISDQLGRSHLYNSVRLDTAHAVPDLLKAGVTWFMVDATLMNVEETSAAVARLAKARNLANSQGLSLPKEEGATSGHLFRGVL